MACFKNFKWTDINAHNKTDFMWYTVKGLVQSKKNLSSFYSCCGPVKGPAERHELGITWNKYTEQKYKYSIGKRVLNVSLTAKVLGWSFYFRRDTTLSEHKAQIGGKGKGTKTVFSYEALASRTYRQQSSFNQFFVFVFVFSSHSIQ